MKIEGAIFDFDGTLVDSMFIWETLAADYLSCLGMPTAAISDSFATCMTLQDMAEIYQREYGIAQSSDAIVSDLRRRIDERYATEVAPKGDILMFLEYLRKSGIPMCIATLSEEKVVRFILEKYSMTDYFSDIITTETVGKGKNEPDMYLAALERLGTKREKTFVFEDAIYAARTAKQADFPVVAVYDPSEKQQDSLQKIADVYIKDYKSMINFLEKN